jgi:integrase
VECLRLGPGMPGTVRPDPSTLGVVGERGSRHEGRSQPVSGRLLDLFQEPVEVIGATIDDEDGDDAGHLVGMLALGAVNDLGEQAASGAQGDSALGLVVDLALPAVDGPDGLEVVPEAHSRSNFRRRCWLPATTAAGVEGLRFHDLRHSAATLALAAGANTRELMERMGHTSPAVALRYQHVMAGRAGGRAA